VKLGVQVLQIFNKRVGIALDIGATRTEQLGLDGVKAAVGVGPGVDPSVQLGNKAGREHF